jgi:S1/P1 Nuclease
MYKAQAGNEWLHGVSLEDLEGSALVWAGESNAFVCKAVLPGGREKVEGMELSGSYFEEAVPVVESLVARAGYRYGLLSVCSYID